MTRRALAVIAVALSLVVFAVGAYRDSPRQPAGFERTRARVDLDGETCHVCVWIASTPAQQARGLMEVADLGPADAMAFVYDEPTTAAFWMKNTPIALSVVFYSSAGRYLDSFDMEPCAADPCETFPTPADFTVAIETPVGDLDALGLVAGSTLTILDQPCDLDPSRPVLP